jgi:hypothetical protein
VTAPVQSGSLAERTDAFEREQILAELKRHHQRMTDTARALGLERSHLYKKCQALGIDLRAMRSGGRRAGHRSRLACGNGVLMSNANDLSGTNRASSATEINSAAVRHRGHLSELTGVDG